MRHPSILLLGLFLLLPSTHADASETAQLRNELGIIHARGGHFEDALRQFSMILAEEPESAMGLNNAGNVYFLQGDHERARQLYEQAHREAPQVGGILLNLGILEHLLGEKVASRKHVREGMALVGDLDTAYYLLGLSRSAGGERASDEAGVREVEIEALLTEAMAEIPEAGTKDGVDNAREEEASENRDHELATRAGGTKAAEIDAQVERLYWMTGKESP